MIYGEKSEFAIELDVVAGTLDEDKLVRARFWLKEGIVGNDDEVSLLKLFVFGLEGVKERLDRQRGIAGYEEIEEDPKGLFDALYRAAWEDGEPPESFPALVGDVNLYWGLPIGVEIFDGEAMFVIRFIDHDLVLWRSWVEKEVRFARFRVGLIQKVIEEALNAVGTL